MAEIPKPQCLYVDWRLSERDFGNVGTDVRLLRAHAAEATHTGNCRRQTYRLSLCTLSQNQRQTFRLSLCTLSQTHLPDETLVSAALLCVGCWLLGEDVTDPLLSHCVCPTSQKVIYRNTPGLNCWRSAFETDYPYPCHLLLVPQPGKA